MLWQFDESVSQSQVSIWTEEAAHAPKLLCIHCFASQRIIAESLGFFSEEELVILSLLGEKDEQQVSEEQSALFPPTLMSGREHFPVVLCVQ